MKNLNGFTAISRFIGALTILGMALLNFKTALSYSGLENQFLADNWGTPLVILLTFLFGFGWWAENRVEQVVLKRGRKAANFVVITFIILIYGGSLIISMIFSPFSFIGSVIAASGSIITSGFLLRLSVIGPEISAKLQERT